MEEENTSVESNTANERIKLNVGGKYFETTLSTLHSGGPDSLLFALSNRHSADPNPVFINREPEIFSNLLSLLRTSHLPSTMRRFSKQMLADEALFYGIDAHLSSLISFSSFDDCLKEHGMEISASSTITDHGPRLIVHLGYISVVHHQRNSTFVKLQAASTSTPSLPAMLKLRAHKHGTEYGCWNRIQRCCENEEPNTTRPRNG